MKKTKISLWSTLTLGLLINYSAVAMEGHNNALYDRIHFYINKINDTAHTLGRSCPVSKNHLVPLFLLGLAVAAGGQNSTELSECLGLLNQCVHNNTALLNQVLANTMPTPGVDAYLAYWWGIFGDGVSTAGLFGGIIITAIFDFGAGYFYERRAEERVHEFLNEAVLRLEKDMEGSNGINKNRLMGALVSLTMQYRGVDENQAKQLVEDWLGVEEEIAFTEFISGQ